MNEIWSIAITRICRKDKPTGWFPRLENKEAALLLWIVSRKSSLLTLSLKVIWKFNFYLTCAVSSKTLRGLAMNWFCDFWKTVQEALTPCFLPQSRSDRASPLGWLRAGCQFFEKEAASHDQSATSQPHNWLLRPRGVCGGNLKSDIATSFPCCFECICKNSQVVEVTSLGIMLGHVLESRGEENVQIWPMLIKPMEANKVLKYAEEISFKSLHRFCFAFVCAQGWVSRLKFCFYGAWKSP